MAPENTEHFLQDFSLSEQTYGLARKTVASKHLWDTLYGELANLETTVHNNVYDGLVVWFDSFNIKKNDKEVEDSIPVYV